MYDVIIIGAGIAGLYAAYKITKLSPKLKILVLEKNERKYLGGRMGVDDFKGASVPIGAGVGRKHKDFRLIDLLDELNIKYGEFPVVPSYAVTLEDCSVKKTFMMLKRNYDAVADKPKTFKQFAAKYLKPNEYKHFITCAGYTDYENEDAYGTLFLYGFDDNYDSWTALSINWQILLNKLVESVGEKNITCSHEVSKIKYNERDEQFLIFTKTKQEYLTKKIILATTIDSVQKLLPGAKLPRSIYQQICGQTFIRIYGQFSKDSIPIMKTYVSKTTVVPGPIHKIIPMNPNDGIYMIVYSDNAGADILHKFSKNTEVNCNVLSRLIERSIGIPGEILTLTDIVSYYWQIGTHYYKPLRGSYKNRKEFIHAAQRPMTNILVVGEMISTHQGWVEGALESVDKTLNKKWLT
jgi:hypothetical protein